MTTSPFLNSHRTLAVTCFVALVAAALSGCDRAPAAHKRTLVTRGNDGGVYLRSVSDTLNDLADNVDLELQPAQPILTASSSADGKEVLAICSPNPSDGQINYLVATTGNAKFASIDVRPGDVVRYYVNVDQESAERGLEQRTALQLKVRRLATNDPENALIIDGALDAPATVPQRIEIWRYSDKRMDAIRSSLNRYVVLRLPPLGWEPAPDVAALQQVVERANQWLRSRPDDKQWQPGIITTEVLEEVRKIREPLVATLLAKLTGDDRANREALEKQSHENLSRLISAKGLRSDSVAEWEGRQLAEAAWCRDIAQWARGSATSDADVAAALFDWTVRNVQLDRPGLEVTIHHPWQALMYGHGSTAHRAWVFVEMCRQQQIDAAVLCPAGIDLATAPLLVGVLVEDNVLLFDPKLGLPLRGKTGTLATLAELAADDSLFRQFDVSGEPPYPLTAEHLKHLDAFIVASPLQLARRSELVQSGLEGEQFIRLSANPKSLAERLKRHAEIKSAKLWPQPFLALIDEWTMPEIQGDPEHKLAAQPYRQMAAAEFAPFAERPLLWKARLLHFQGNKDIRAAERSDPLAEDRPGHLQAVKLYLDPSVRPSNAKLAKLEADKQTVYKAAKANASYWLGLLSYDRGNYDVSLNWLGDRTLDVAAQGRWGDGARYNLARTQEALGHFEEAAKLLQDSPKEDPQRHGNLLRARALGEKAAAAKTDAKS